VRIQKLQRFALTQSYQQIVNNIVFQTHKINSGTQNAATNPAPLFLPPWHADGARAPANPRSRSSLPHDVFEDFDFQCLPPQWGLRPGRRLIPANGLPERKRPMENAAL